MGNSTKSLQSVVDYCATIGDLNPIFVAGGYTNLLPQQVGSDVMTEFIAEKFNWKFNRMVLPPFYTISYQQDYASISQKNIGWLEHGVVIDINNTAQPKPMWPLWAVRDLERSSDQLGRPLKMCWLPNDQLVQGTWPGANVTFTNPLGAVSAPANPLTNILDANGNILVLTTYGVTGGVAPLAAAGAAAGVTVNDGSCVWTVADPKAQGIRLGSLPSQTGVVWQVNPIAQARAVAFTSLTQLLDPIPDDYSKYFIDGFIAFMHRHSAAPAVKARFERMKQDWLQSLMAARGQGDREPDESRLVPERGIMDQGYGYPIGPAWPYGPFGMG